MEIRIRVAEHVGKFVTLLEIVKKRKAIWHGHVVRAEGTMTNIMLQGKVEGDIKYQRRSAIQWFDEVREWTGLRLNEM